MLLEFANAQDAAAALSSVTNNLRIQGRSQAPGEGTCWTDEDGNEVERFHPKFIYAS